jgi:hypothetical protein
MLDLVQRSFEAGVIPTCEVFRVAALSMLLTASDDIFRFLSQNNDTFVRVSRDFKRLLSLTTKLSRTISIT